MFRKLQNPSPWRRLALATWKAPNDPTVLGHFEVDATPVLDFIGKFNTTSSTRITMTHVIAKAVALMFKKYPDLNGIIRWKKIYLRDTVDLFMQVAISEEDSKGRADLSGAIVRGCENKSIAQIADELINQSQKIRKREDPQFKSSHSLFNFIPDFILPYFLRFMTFLVYNLGINAPKLGLPADPFGSAMITSVGSLNVQSGFAPLVPCSRVPLIICLGAIIEKPWVENHQVVVKPVAEMSVTFDHRFIDGLVASRMLKYFKGLLAEPEKYLV